MGVSPNDRDSVCTTCGHRGLECSGHPGHIELVVPTYNPLIIDVLLKLLRMNCFYCHRFRIRERIKEDYVVLLELLRRDKISEAYEFFDINVEEERRKLERLEAEPETEKNTEAYLTRLNKCRKRIEYADVMRNEYHKDDKAVASSTSIQLFSEFIKFLYGLAQKKCPYVNCKRESKGVKKEGANKIFLIDREGDEEDEQVRQRKKSRDSLSKGESTAHPTI